MNEETFILGKFREYYSSHPPQVEDVEKREFGFGTWEKKIEYRHMHFKSNEELFARILNDKPPFISYSAAYYEFPDARPMVKKSWKGAELIFDLDAKHSEWDTQKKFPDCDKFTCEKCFSHIKEQAWKLIEEFLIPDFGFEKKDISVNFSGNRGYHVRVKNEEVISLGREERREIVDYVLATGIGFSNFFSFVEQKLKEASKERKNTEPMPSQGGYFGKFARKTIERLQEKEFAEWLLGKKNATAENIEKFARGVKEGNWDAIHIRNRDEKFQKIFEELKAVSSAEIDANVTFDTSKLLRMPDSLHGSSGMCAKRMRLDELEKFEPTKEAAIFGEKPTRVKTVEKIPTLSFLNSTFGPFEVNAEAELPESLAVYLICKRSALISAKPS